MEIFSTDTEMSDAILAARMIRDVAGPRGSDEPIKVLWERAYQALSKYGQHWTRRRIRALWAGEAARVEYREIKEMAIAIAARERLIDARKEHAERLARIARLEALLVAQDEAFHSPEIGALRDTPFGMGGPGTEE